MERYLNVERRRDCTDEMRRLGKNVSGATKAMYVAMGDYLEKVNCPYGISVEDKTDRTLYPSISMLLREDGPDVKITVGWNERDGIETFRDFRKGRFDQDLAKQAALSVCKDFSKILKYVGRVGPMEDIFYLLCSLINQGYDPVQNTIHTDKRCRFVLVKNKEYIAIAVSKRLKLKKDIVGNETTTGN